MQSEGNTRKDQQQQQVSRVQSGRLEDRLHQGNVDQTQLHDERDRDGGDQHPVLGDPAAETAILNGGNQIEEDETCEGLRDGRSQLLQKSMHGETSCHCLFPTRHLVVRQRVGVDEQCFNYDN